MRLAEKSALPASQRDNSTIARRFNAGCLTQKPKVPAGRPIAAAWFQPSRWDSHNRGIVPAETPGYSQKSRWDVKASARLDSGWPAQNPKSLAAGTDWGVYSRNCQTTAFYCHFVGFSDFPTKFRSYETLFHSLPTTYRSLPMTFHSLRTKGEGYPTMFHSLRTTWES